MSEMADAIRALQAEKGISEDSIRQTIKNMIKAWRTARSTIIKMTPIAIPMRPINAGITIAVSATAAITATAPVTAAIATIEPF